MMKKNKVLNLFSILVIIMGIGILSYPIFSNYMSAKVQEKSISTYKKVVDHTSKPKIKDALRLAQEYNDNLAGKPVHDPFSPNQGYVLSGDYNKLLNINNDGIMGTLEIPTIDVDLPIYHGISDEVLKLGVGHIEGSSLPVGGNHCHCYLSGHRGLPEATLFTHLNRLKCNDEFYIHVLGEILAYKVYDIRVVKPSELNSLRADGDGDIVTLITCTPYGINTHRLLVYGKRVKYNPSNAKNEAVKSLYNKIDYKYMILGIFAALLLIMVINLIRKRKR